jgi:hypothetical protein
LQEEEAHVILHNHFLNDIIQIDVELLHEFINLIELALDSLDQNMSQVLVIISQ